jgi:hypothetical protein
LPDPGQEAAIQLQHVDDRVPQIGERRVSGPVVVDRDLDTEFA